MYSEEFEEASVEFDEADEAPPAAANTVSAQEAAPPVPLSDDELDAYLAEDGVQPATAQPDAFVVPEQKAYEHVQERSTADGMVTKAVQPEDGQFAESGSDSSTLLVEQDAVITEPVDSEGHAATEFVSGSSSSARSSIVPDEPARDSLSAPLDDEHSQQLQQFQHDPVAAVELSAQVTPRAAHHAVEGLGAASARTSSSAGSHGSSTHASTAGDNLPGVQELQNGWMASGIPGSAFSTHNAVPAAAGSDSPSTSMQQVLRSSMDNSPGQHKVKLRPASASPAVRRSSSTLQQQEQDDGPVYSPASSSPALHQYQYREVLPLADWTVNDVCDWVDGMGLSQYRKKFMHHVVDGRLLLRLSDVLLRTELGIGPLGHRVLIKDSLQAVASADLQQAAAAALAGASPEDFQANSDFESPSAAAAVLVAGLIALRAGQRGGSGRNSPWLLHSSNGGGCAGLSAAADSPDRAGQRSPAGRRARPSSAPCKGKGGERSASPAGGRGSPSPGALGPAAGRISVYEQRAKILFELGRAQARAASTAGTATEVAGVAKLAQKEVALLQGQLADLDKKNKLAVRHSSGSVDTRGIIPWQHVGNGTNAADPHPERLARPWDSPEAELTFQPKISAKSQQLMAEARGNEGAGGFLDRLDNDMRRREAKQKELEKRFYSGSSSAEAGKAAKAAAADFAVLAGFLSQRGWATLTVPSSNSSSGGTGGVKLTEADYRELDSQLDEVVEAYSEELGLGKSDSKHSHAILAARGPKKLAAMVAVVRTQQFMDRYHADLSTRGNRMQQLQDTWFKQQLTVTASPGRPAAVPLTPEQKDLAQAVQWFRGMGWEEAAEADGCDDLISSLVKRARHYKTEAERLHDKERAAATAAGASPAAAAAHGAGLPNPNINWSSAPWSVDGLGALMQTVLDAKKAASDATAAKQAAASKSSPARAAGGQGTGGAAAGAGGAEAAVGAAVATLESAAASGVNTLDLSVRLLAGMRWAGLDQLDAATGKAKKLAVYRALRTQQFLAFTAADLAGREAKQRAMLEQFEASRRGKLVTRAELDEFYVRLQADGERRKAELEKARHDKAEREAKALALVSVGPGFSRRPRPRSAKS